ncbi:MAG TPA: PAS domain S-box protein, partial [Bacteroidota bacterium]
GALRNFQVRFKTKSGEIGHALLSRDIIELAGEKHYIGTTLDITERVRTEEALRESEERFRSLFENSSIGFYRTTPDGHVLLANPAFIRMLGYESFEQFSKINLEKGDYAPQYSRFEFRKRIEKDGEIKGLESTWTRKDGTRIFVRESAKVTRRADGKVLYYEGTVEDVTDRKLAEEKLRESEQKFRSVADTASTAMFIYQGERFRFVNRYGQLLTGYSQDELLQKTFWELVHPDHREMVRQRGLARQSGDPVAPRYEFKIIAKNGEVHWVDFTAGKIEFEGEPAAIGTIVDITQRKQAEEELREKENRMRIIIEGTPYLFFYTQDLEKKITYISPSVETITGHSVDDWRFQSHWFVTENKINEHAREITNAHLRGELTEGPILVEVKHADGHPILLEVYETPIVSDGHVTGLQGVAHDITERKRTEESLIRLNKAVEASGEVIFMTDPDGIFTFVNGAFARLYGYQPEEVVGTATPRILKSGRQSAEQYVSFWQALKNKQIVKGEWTNRTKDGRFVTIAATANPILDANGTIIGFLAIQRNVTDQRSLEEQMRQAQKMESIGTLASGIAHDFNNILGIILGHASLIERFRNEPARLSESVATIINATKRGAAVVRQMLTFARKNEVEFKPLLINDSVNEIEKLLRETFPRTIALVCRLDQKLPLITADATQIHQVLLNLCVNARDAMGGSGTLTISTSHCSGAALQGRFVKAIHASYVVVEVRDTGSGMDEETRRRIFEPFFTTKGVGKGTGLGLSVVFGIMESHDGFVDVVSKVGHGTTFSLYFPVQSPAFGGSERDSGPDQESAGGTETVLVVEDEESLRESARLSLSLKGYTVLTAENGVNAMEIFKSRWKEIAVVVCDFGLPKHDGREVLSMMKAVNPAVRFVLASGFIDPEEKSEILKDGAKDFLQKPYVANDLLRKIREVIDF